MSAGMNRCEEHGVAWLADDVTECPICAGVKRALKNMDIEKDVLLFGWLTLMMRNDIDLRDEEDREAFRSLMMLTTKHIDVSKTVANIEAMWHAREAVNKAKGKV